MKISLGVLLGFYRDMSDGRVADAMMWMPKRLRRKVAQACLQLEKDAPPPERWEPDPSKRRVFKEKG